jgi:hypothetical protein
LVFLLPPQHLLSHFQSGNPLFQVNMEEHVPFSLQT